MRACACTAARRSVASSGACSLFLRRTLLDIAGQIGFQQLRRAWVRGGVPRARHAGRGPESPSDAASLAAPACVPPSRVPPPAACKNKEPPGGETPPLCERYSLTPRKVNVWIAGWLVDACGSTKSRSRDSTAISHTARRHFGARSPARPQPSRRGLVGAALHLRISRIRRTRDRRPAPRATSVSCRGRSRSRRCGPSRPGRTGAPCSRSPRSCPRYPSSRSSPCGSRRR